MTFIDNSAEKPTPTFIILFSIIAFFYLLCALFTFHRSNTRRHYSRIYSIRILFPLACLSCLAENIAIAASGSIIDKKLSHHDLLKVIYVLQAFQVPIYLVVIFELTYLVHKRRSVHFCGMFFDEGRLGRRVKGVFSTPVKSFVFRNLIRFIALISLVVGCLANLDLLRDRDIKDELAGRTGWWKLWDTEGDRVWTVHILMSLVPTAILIFCSFFLSIALWRYGSNSSMVLHSSYACFNPWFFPMFGTIALSIGQLFYQKLYPLTSNLGMLIYTFTLMVLMREIDREIFNTVEFTDFLKQVAVKGNQISVMNDMNGNGRIRDHNQRMLEEIDEEVIV